MFSESGMVAEDPLEDKETAEYFSTLVSDISMLGDSFKAWARGEHGELQRMTQKRDSYLAG